MVEPCYNERLKGWQNNYDGYDEVLSYYHFDMFFSIYFTISGIRSIACYVMHCIRDISIIEVHSIKIPLHLANRLGTLWFTLQS